MIWPFDDTLRGPPRRRIDTTKVKVDGIMDIPQIDPSLPRITYRIYAATQHFGGVCCI